MLQKGRAAFGFRPEEELGVNADVFRLNSRIELKHWWFAARREILREIIREVLAPSREITIVDVGCGTGGNTASLSCDYHCVGIDPSADAIELARTRYPHLEFIHGRAPGDLKHVVREAKLFLLADVLEHVADDVSLLSRLVAATSPGAYFLITVPADMSLWSPHDESHGHYRRYDMLRFEVLWQHLPVKPLLVSYFNARLYQPIKLVRAVNRRLGKASGREGTDVRLPPSPVNRFLKWALQSEGKVLMSLLRGERRRGYSCGVSLIALLRREARAPLSVEEPASEAPEHQLVTAGGMTVG